MIPYVLIVESLEDFQRLLDCVMKCSEDTGLTFVNFYNIKFMKVTESSLWTQGELVEKFNRHKYTGMIVNENNEYMEEIRSRIGQALTVFNKIKNILCGKISIYN